MSKTCFKSGMSKERALCCIADAIRDLAEAIREGQGPKIDIKWPPASSGESPLGDTNVARPDGQLYELAPWWMNPALPRREVTCSAAKGRTA